MAIDKNYVPKLYKVTANMTTKQWEDERRNSIGGSDMAVIMGLSPYGKTKRELYYDKVGVTPIKQKPDYEKQIIFDSGHFLENMVADLFSYRTGLETYEVKAMFEHPLHPHIRGNIDRFYRYKGTKSPISFMECKSTTEYNREWDNDSIPPQYSVQIATYMAILNLDFCKISCLFIPEQLRYVAGILFQLKNVFGALSKDTLGDIRDQLLHISDAETKLYVPMVLSALGGEFLVPNHLLEETSDAVGKKFIIRHVERDETLEEEILSKADDFWFNFVKKGIEPSLDDENGSDAISTLNRFVTKKPMKSKILPNNVLTNIKQIAELKKKKSELDARKKQYDAQIQKLSVPIIEALDGCSNGTVIENPFVSHQVSYCGKEKTYFPKKNLEKLRNSYPEAYDECVENEQTSASLTLKEVRK